MKLPAPSNETRELEPYEMDDLFYSYRDPVPAEAPFLEAEYKTEPPINPYYETSELLALPYSDLMALREVLNDRFPAELINLRPVTHPNTYIFCARKHDAPAIYMFGTVHIDSPRIRERFNPIIPSLVSRVDKVFLEFATAPVPLATDSLVLDKVFEVEAIKQGKALQALENYNTRRAAGVTDFMTEDTPSETRSIYHEELTQEYLTELTPPNLEIDDCCVLNRNKFWLHTLALQTTPCLVACGYAHLLGPGSLPHLLSIEGYTISPIEPQSLKARQDYPGTFFKPHSNTEAPATNPSQPQTQPQL